MRLELRSFSTAIATLGYIRFPEPARGWHGLWTIERPWMENRTHVSCIPGGWYRMVPYSSDGYPDTWALEGEHVSVQPLSGVQRNLILFHVANWWDDVEGCIGPGVLAREMENPRTGRIEPSVVSSGDAMKILRDLLGDTPEDHSITIFRDFEPTRWQPAPA